MLNGFRTRILVVDDSKDTADSMVQVLGFWGHHAEGCYNGPSALKAAQTFQPHVVLVDLSMPGMDGFQFAQSLREQPESQHAVLMALTGHSDDAYRSCAWGMGFAQYLVKPIDLDKLRGLLTTGAFSEADFVPLRALGPQSKPAAERQQASCSQTASLGSPPPLY